MPEALAASAVGDADPVPGLLLAVLSGAFLMCLVPAGSLRLATSARGAAQR